MPERARWDVQGLTPLVMGGVSILMGTLYLFYIRRKFPETLYDRTCPNRRNYASPFPYIQAEPDSENDWLDNAAASTKEGAGDLDNSKTAIRKPAREQLSQSDGRGPSKAKLLREPNEFTQKSYDKSLDGKRSPDNLSTNEVLQGGSTADKYSPSSVVDEQAPFQEPKGSPSTSNHSAESHPDKDSIQTNMDPSISPSTPEGQPSTATSSSTIEDRSLPATMK